MALTVKRLTLWRREEANRPGLMAETLSPLAEAGTDLQVVMGYRIPGQEQKAVIEVAPVIGRKREDAARAGRLSPATSIPTLIVRGENRPGLGHAMARQIADAGIDMAFLVAQVLGDRYSAVFGFPSEGDARKAEELIRKATTGMGRRARTGARKAPARRRRPAAKARSRARGKSARRR